MSIMKKSKKPTENLFSDLPVEILTRISSFTGECYIYRNRTIRFRCNICYNPIHKMIYYFDKDHLKFCYHIDRVKELEKRKKIN